MLYIVCVFKELRKEDEEYKRLLEYVKNTHAATHNMYDLEVEEVGISLDYWLDHLHGQYG